MSVPAHMFGLPPGAIRMKARREREESLAFMRATIDKMHANGRALDVALARLVAIQEGAPVDDGVPLQ